MFLSTKNLSYEPNKYDILRNQYHIE